MRIFILLILLSGFVFGQKNIAKATLDILEISTSSKLTSPYFNLILVKSSNKVKNWFMIQIKYQIKNIDSGDKTSNSLKIISDFVVPNSEKKGNFYIFSKTLSYSSVFGEEEYYAVFLINPHSIMNYFLDVNKLKKNLYARFSFKLNGKTLDDKMAYIVKGKRKKKADKYGLSRYASEDGENISNIILTRVESPWKNIQYDSFNKLD